MHVVLQFTLAARGATYRGLLYIAKKMVFVRKSSVFDMPLYLPARMRVGGHASLPTRERRSRDACMVNMDSLVLMPWIVNVRKHYIAAGTKPSCLGNLLAPKARNRVHVLVRIFAASSPFF
jgi:hypothetical protein